VQEFTRRNPEHPGVGRRGLLSTYVKWALDARWDEGGGVIRDELRRWRPSACEAMRLEDF
jgi:hypothetical protein